jgi:hypothetical protein
MNSKKLYLRRGGYKGAQQGDADAFAYLYSVNKGRAHALCLGMTRGDVTLFEDHALF